MAVGMANSIRMRDHPAAQPVSPKWFKRSLTSQDPNGLVPRKMKSIEAARDAAYDPNSIISWLASLKAVLEEHGFLPDEILNFDDTRYSIGVGGD
jgi:hypothetical protein